MSNAEADAHAGILTAKISQTATSDIVTNTDSNKKIRVHSVLLNVDAAISVNWTDGTAGTALEGIQDYAANGGYTDRVKPPSFLFECSAGNDLELTQTGTGTVAGRISYTLANVENSAGAGFGPTSTA